MHKQIYVNLAVNDLPRSTAFFKGLGFDFNPQFTSDQGACMVIGENIFVMLLIKDFFKTFTAGANHGPCYVRNPDRCVLAQKPSLLTVPRRS